MTHEIERVYEQFSQFVDLRTMNKMYHLLNSKGLSNFDVITIMFCIAAICASHYNNGYNSAAIDNTWDRDTSR